MTIGKYTVKHNEFGGEIFPSDFCTDYEGSRNIAERIISNWKFDEQCKKNIEARNRKRKEDNKNV